MADCQVIAGNIRAYLAAGEVRWTDEMRDLAAAYAAECRDVNDRLRRCGEYLRRGMRSEAIHLAECQPGLVETVSALNFPERKAWVEACAAHGLPTPPALLTESLESLQAAYARELRLRPLLSRHRMLALAKATARERLDILRLLTEHDRDNPCWAGEARALEAVRVREIRAEARAAIDADNAEVLEQLWTEVTGRPWHDGVPEDLRQALGEAVAAVRRQRIETDLRALTPELLAAFEAEPRNGELTGLLDRWDELAGAAGGDVPDELREQMQPVLDWRVEEARRQTEREEVRPFQQAPDAADADAPPAQRGSKRLVAAAIGVVGAALVAAAAGYGYFSGHLGRFLK